MSAPNFQPAEVPAEANGAAQLNPAASPSLWSRLRTDAKAPNLVLLIAALGAAALVLVVQWQLRQSSDEFTFHLFALAAVAFLLDEERATIRFNSSRLAVACGALLIAQAVAKACTVLQGDDYRHILALVLGLGLGLMAFGLRELSRYWRAFLILATLSIFDIPFKSVGIGPLHLNELGASIAGNILLVLGYPATAIGDVVTLTGGSVRVYGPCSAAVPLLNLLKLALIVLLIFRTNLWQKLLVTGSAVVVALLSNAIRIGIMAVLAAAGDQVRFHYWHEGAGANIFPVLYGACFAALTALCLKTWHPPRGPSLDATS